MICDLDIIFDYLYIGLDFVGALDKVVVLVHLFFKLLKSVGGELAVRKYTEQ